MSSGRGCFHARETDLTSRRYQLPPRSLNLSLQTTQTSSLWELRDLLDLRVEGLGEFLLREFILRRGREFRVRNWGRGGADRMMEVDWGGGGEGSDLEIR